MTERIDAIRALYAGIPPVECKAGCNACCGPTPCYPEEFEACGGTPGDDVIRVEGGLVLTCTVVDGAPKADCRFAIEGGCGSYENRPLICRLYATAYQTTRGRHTCPEGARSHPLLKADDVRERMRTYLSLGRRRAGAL